tara:strand:+ start:1522 stop:2091 length:570 start_codon:yes stop_codon:yes gene_type:complete
MRGEQSHKGSWQQCKRTLKRLKYIFIGLTFPLLLNSCGFNRNELEINFDQSIEVANLMDKFSIQELTISRDNHIRLDNLLILPDSVDRHGIEPSHGDSIVSLTEWTNATGFSKTELSNLKRLLTESNNTKIVKENGAFFFMTGSWIDAQWGKVYSKTDISNQEDSFSFGRVQEIEPIKDRPNWFDYYVD